MQMIDCLRADAVFGWRQLNKHRATSAAAILSLGVAMGACTAAFQLIDALFLRPLPISDPQRLYVVSRPAVDKFGEGWEQMRFRRMRAAMKDQADLIAVSFPEEADLTSGDDQAIEKAQVQYVSGWMFRSFGLRPALGRFFTEGEDLEPGAHPMVILSYTYWSRHFRRDRKVVGNTMTITPEYGMGSRIFEIVGVVGQGFTGTEPGTETDIFIPSMMHPLAEVPVASLFRIFVRLPPRVASDSIRGHLEAVLRALNQQDGKRFPYRQTQTLTIKRAGSGVSAMQENYAQALMALGGLVVLVLLIACANVANLMSARAAARGREMALRVSIGAGKTRLVRLVLVEGAMLAFAAAAVGAVIGWQAAPFVVARINPPETPAQLSLSGDWRVWGVGLALTFAVAILSGLPAAWRASDVSPASALRGGEDPRSHGRMMNILLAVQAAFCFLVLFVSGLFTATSEHLTRQSAGFPVSGLLALDTITPQDEPPSAWALVAAHLRSVSGVENAAVSEWPLLDGDSYRFNRVSIAGRRPGEANVRFLIVSSGWIDTMQIPMIEGRVFRDGESGAVIVNREFAREYFPGEHPVGQWFEADPGGKWGRRFQIVGVAGDTRYRTVRDPILPVAYVPYQLAWHAETLMVRVAPSKRTNPLALASILQQQVSRALPRFRVKRIRTQEGMLLAQTIRERLLAALAAFFAAVALLLAAIGLYGVLNFSVFQRRREIGIRMAIGAQATSIVRLITIKSITVVLAGVFVGAALGRSSVRYIGTELYQVRPTDLANFAIPVLIILMVGVLAGLPAVIGAVRVDPVNVLRAD